MCGVVGILDRNGHAERFAESLSRATDQLRHRGPDDRGEFCDGPVALGFRRLSILDLSASGHQPMTSSDGRWTLVYNGEIYNFIELRQELVERGVRFRGQGDTEVLLEALALWGPEALERCNGMWSLLAWNVAERALYAARDPWGIKPLYVSEQDGWTGFASEIKALRRLGCDVGGVDPVAAYRFLADGALDTDSRTLFSGVHRLEPGRIYRFSQTDAPRSDAYDDGTRHVDVPDPADEEGFVSAFRTTFVDAVRIRLRSDVSVGTSLSGGLDSTAITGATSQLLTGERVQECRHAFTALFPEFDESPYIEPLIEQTRAEWHKIQIEDDTFVDKTERCFAAHDEPLHSLSPLAGYLVMELASACDVTVLLNGQGSDELLAGYPSAAVPFLRSLVRDEGLRYAHAQLRLEANGARDTLGMLFRTHATPLLRSQLLERVRSAPDAPSGVGGTLHAAAEAAAPRGLYLEEALEKSVKRSPLPLYLRIEDANSMAFSLEARLPFLDPRLVAFARRAPARLLRRDGLNKYLLRRILPGLVPDVVRQRKTKMGFPVPHERWFRGPLQDMFRDALDDATLDRRGWYDTPEVARMRDDFLTQTGPLPPTLLRLFLLEKWARQQLDGV